VDTSPVVDAEMLPTVVVIPPQSSESMGTPSTSTSFPSGSTTVPLTAVASLIVKHSTCSHESCCRLVLVGAMSGMKSLTSLEAKTILSEQQLLFLNPQDTYQ